MAEKTAISSTKKSTVTEPQAKKSTMRSIRNLKTNLSMISSFTAEFVGTFMLVASIFAVQGQPLFVAFALIGIVLIVGGVSGGYVNPAMTIGAWVTKKIESKRAIGYIIAQVLGAGFAWLILSAFMSGSNAVTGTATASSLLFHAATIAEGKEWFILFAELIGSIVVAFGIASALKMKKDKTAAAFVYGLALLIGLLIAGSVTSMFLTEANTTLTFLNPAVAIAANGVSWYWSAAIYLLAPTIGAIAGFAMQDFLYLPDTEDKN
ncbi:MAG: aquaporin [Patescibacteria group bacterium]|nr:aquaporin [Patescibacteria group bacterium]